MRENHTNGENVPARRRSSTGKMIVILAALSAVIQAFLTINGRGIEGFVLWIIILFVTYWLLFRFLIWLWRIIRRRS
jgi:hypothetical protein